jgi:hypothetical protein
LADLTAFGLSDLVRLSAAVRDWSASPSLEAGAADMVRTLRRELRDADGSQAPLVQFYLTRRLGELPVPAPDGPASRTSPTPEPDAVLLYLVASAAADPALADDECCEIGAEPDGGPRRPLGSMMPALLDQLGVEPGWLTEPDAEKVLELSSRLYGVFHVGDAPSNPMISDTDLVRRAGVRSVVAFGSILPSGQLYTVIIFSRVAISAATAHALQPLSVAAKVGMLPHLEPASLRSDPVVAVVADLHQLLELQETSALDQATRLERSHRTDGVLLELAAKLAATLTPEDVGRVSEEVLVPAVGARGFNMAYVDPAARLVRLVNTTFFGPSNMGATREVPFDVITPMTAAARFGDVVHTQSRAQTLRRFPDVATNMAALGGEAVVALPLRAGDKLVGSLAAFFATPLDATEVPWELLSIAAGMCGPALARAILFKAEQQSVLAMQHSLLPGALPKFEGLTISARYAPAGAGSDVGGDWYDVIDLGDGVVGLAIGDVEGHDHPAAALMGQMRAAVRAYALEGHPPAAVMEQANRLLTTMGTDRFVTLLYAQLHVAERILSVVSAGHPPMIAVDSDRASLVEVDPGPPLGVLERFVWRETTVLLPPRATIVAFTDGMIERGAAPLDLQLADACRRAASAAASVDSMIEDLIEHARSYGGDDVAVLGLALCSDRESGHRARRRLPASRIAVPVARRFVRDLLSAWEASDVSDAAELAMSELVTNAVRVSEDPVELRVELTEHMVRLSVADTSHRDVVMHPDDLDSTSGRGLQLVQAVSASWGVVTEDWGKEVWCMISRSAPSGS